MIEKEEPRYDHDCAWCVFIGRVCEYDVYLCPQHGYPTILARFGDEGQEYMSSSKLRLFLNKDIELSLMCSKGGL